MIVDEKDIGQRFLIDLLRMEGKGDLISTATKNGPQSFDGNIEDILLEIELSDPEINEDMNDPFSNADFGDYQAPSVRQSEKLENQQGYHRYEKMLFSVEDISAIIINPGRKSCSSCPSDF